MASLLNCEKSTNERALYILIMLLIALTVKAHKYASYIGVFHKLSTIQKSQHCQLRFSYNH